MWETEFSFKSDLYILAFIDDYSYTDEKPLTIVKIWNKEIT